MEERTPKEDEVTILDKNETSDRANGKLSFVPEDYGKREVKTPATNNIQQGPGRPKSKSSKSNVFKQDPSLPAGMAKCEFCGNIDNYESYLNPSRRFCNVTCCKRYSAEKRYYPYGRDEEGVQMSISQGLVNRHRSLKSNSARAKKQQTILEERKRRLAYFGSNSSNPGETQTPSTKPRRGRRPGSSSSTTPRTPSQSIGSFLEPYSHPHATPIQQWSTDDVSDFLSHLGYEAYIDKFIEHEIDGRALSLVRDHHLLMTLKLRLGPALKIIEHVNVINSIEENNSITEE